MNSNECQKDFNDNKHSLVSMESDSNDSLGLIDISSIDFQYLDSDDCWLQSSDSKSSLDYMKNNNIKDWLRSAFSAERSKGCHMTLVNKLDDLKLMSPHLSNSAINTRTFTRRNMKRESLFNGSALATLYSPVDENELTSPEYNDRKSASHETTFEVKSTRKSLNGTFTLSAADNTFTICNENEMQMNNMDDVEKIAKIQEENLRQSCSNCSSPSRQRSPVRNQWSNWNERDKRSSYLPNGNNNINSNTLTKSKNSVLRHSTIADALVDDLNAYPMVTEDDDDYCYENGYSPDEPTFLPSHSSNNTSTPLVANPVRNVNFSRGTVVPKIMPNVSNLRAHSNYGQSKIGRSEPNLSKRLQPLNKSNTNYLPKSNLYSNKIPNNSTLLENKMVSDSRLTMRNGFVRQAFHNQMPTSGRITSPPPSQSQQQLVGKVSVEGELNRNVRNGRIGGTTNLSRKSTFRVRDFAISEDNLRENDVDLCITNAITNGFQTNKAINNRAQTIVKKNVSKIPGPKSRSGIPVSGTRTAVADPDNNRLLNHTDNSWRNGCF